MTLGTLSFVPPKNYMWTTSYTTNTDASREPSTKIESGHMVVTVVLSYTLTQVQHINIRIAHIYTLRIKYLINYLLYKWRWLLLNRYCKCQMLGIPAIRYGSRQQLLNVLNMVALKVLEWATKQKEHREPIDWRSVFFIGFCRDFGMSLIMGHDNPRQQRFIIYRIHGTGIFTHIWLIFMEHVG